MISILSQNRSVHAFTVCLFTLAVAAAAQAVTVKGTVTDETDGKGLFGATVWVTPADASVEPVGVQVDEDGSFSLTVDTDGAYKVEVSYVGFAPVTISSADIENADAISVALTPSVVNLNALTVSASRRPEKIVDAPAAVSTVESEEIEARTALSVTDHVSGVAGMDVVNTGLNSSNVVNRGFNNIFSTTLLTMVDNRIARIPSLRVNVNQFIPTGSDDVERIEIVGGPGSALYGPNSADGVMHIITRSPLASPGTTISAAGGEQEFGMFSLRHAGRSSTGKFGYKFSGQYYQGRDWASHDSQEPDSIVLFQQSDTGNIPLTGLIDNSRDFDIEKMAFDGRVDVVLNDEGMLILNGGVNRASNIELTGLGAAQAIDWTYGYAQARLTYKDLFAQMFVNGSDAGDTYLLRSGARIVDKSRVYVGQLQHSYASSDKQKFTYGLDAILTRPATERTISGRNEDEDNIDEIGVYLQSETKLSDQLTFLAAARYDDHSVLEDGVFSPRAALKFQPDKTNTFRATFNQAFSTPSTLNFYLDVLSKRVTMNDAGGAPLVGLSQLLGMGNVFLDARGTGNLGFTFNYDGQGRPQIVSLYGNAMTAANPIGFPDPNGYLPPTAQAVWPILRGIAVGGNAALDAVLPAALSGEAQGQYMALNPVTGAFDPVSASSVVDLKPISETKTTTFELGYKGVINKKLAVSVNGYYSEIEDFIGPLRVETPHVFLDPTTFIPQLTADIVAGTGMPTANAQDIATQVATAVGGVPFGLVSPNEVQNPTEVIVTYRNFGDINLMGADIALDYHVNQNWNIGATFTLLEKNFFEDVDGFADIPVNAPKNKFTGKLKYSNPHAGFNARARFRFVDAFPVQSGVFNGDIEKYGVVDLNFDYEFAKNTTAALTVQNVFDNRHIEFIGAPELGRLSILRITRTL